MKDYEITWIRPFPIPQLGLEGASGSKAYLSSFEAERSEEFQRAKKEGAIEVRIVVRSLVKNSPSKMAHMEPPFVGLSRPKKESSPVTQVETVSKTFTFSQEDLISCIEKGVSLALEKFMKDLDSRIEHSLVRVGQRQSVKKSESNNKPKKEVTKSSSPLEEPEMPLPSINFHSGKLSSSIIEEDGGSEGMNSALKRLRSLRKGTND